MTPLTTEAAILAYLGREGEATLSGAADALRLLPGMLDIRLHDMLTQDGCVLAAKRAGEVLYRLSAKGRRLLAKHKAAVAAAYGLEG